MYGSGHLINAINSNSIETVKFLLKQENDISSYSLSECMTTCITLQYQKLVEILLKHGLSVNGTHLLRCVETGNVEILKLLLNVYELNRPLEQPVFNIGNVELVQWGDDMPNVFNVTLNGNDFSESPDYLELAVKKGETEMVRLFLEHETPVSDALFKGAKLDILKLLLEKRPQANLNQALIFACGRGYVDIVSFLLERGIDFHFENDEPLCVAAKGGNLGIVKMLLDRGASVHAQDNLPLKNTANWGLYDTVKLLLDNGADISVDNGIVIKSAVIYGCPKVVKLLVDRGADISVNGYELVITSVLTKNCAVLKVLLEHTKDIYMHDDILLKISMEKDNKDTTSLLLRYYSPNFIIQRNWNKNEVVRQALPEYLIFRRKVIRIQRLVSNWLWKPNGHFCKKTWSEIETKKVELTSAKTLVI